MEPLDKKTQEAKVNWSYFVIIFLFAILVGAGLYWWIQKQSAVETTEEIPIITPTVSPTSTTTATPSPTVPEKTESKKVIFYYESKSKAGEDERLYPSYNVYLYDSGTKKLESVLKNYGGINDYVYRFQMLDDQNMIAISDKKVVKINLSSKKKETLFMAGGGGKVVASPSGQKIAFAEGQVMNNRKKGSVSVYDIKTKKITRYNLSSMIGLQGIKFSLGGGSFEEIVPVAFSRDEKKIYLNVVLGTEGWNNFLVFDTKTRKVVKTDIVGNVISANGAFAFKDTDFKTEDACNAFAGQAYTMLRIFEETKKIGSVQNKKVNFEPIVFSPNGKNLLYSTYKIATESSLPRNEQARMTKCNEIQSEKSFYLYNLQTKKVTKIQNAGKKIVEWFQGLKDVEFAYIFSPKEHISKQTGGYVQEEYIVEAGGEKIQSDVPINLLVPGNDITNIWDIYSER